MAKSLVLITVDCLRADHVGFLGYPRPTTPFLDSLATESWAFCNAFVAGAPTYYSFPAIMASRYPLALGRDVIGLAPGEPSLASLLKRAGYATAGFNAGNPYLTARYGYNQGFDTFCDFLEEQRPQTDGKHPTRRRTQWNARLSHWCRRVGLGSAYEELYFQYVQRVASRRSLSLDDLRQFPTADVVGERAQQWLEACHSRPFFLWLHLMDPHWPFYPGDEALRLMDDAKVGPSQARYLNQYWNRRELGARRLQRHRDGIVRLYDASIRWVDAQIARLADTLATLGLWQECALVVTADHGEEFLDHGSPFHSPWTCKEELIKVPLLMRLPGIARGRACTNLFSHLDLAPTLLSALKVPVPADFQGRSRLDSGSSSSGDAVVIIENGDSDNPGRPDTPLSSRVLCVREQRYKLILRFGSQSEELYDLQDDPREISPIAPDQLKPIRRRLLEHAHKHMNRCSAAGRAQYQLAAQIRELREHISWRVRPKSDFENHDLSSTPIDARGEL